MKYFNKNNGRIVSTLPNKVNIDNKIIFSPKWEKLYNIGWRELPIEYNSNTWMFDLGEYRTMTQEELDERENQKTEQRIQNDISRLWNYFHSFADSQMDGAARHSINLLITHPTTPQETLVKINEYSEWWQLLWVSYGEYRQRIVNGETLDIDNIEIQECPYTIWDIVKNNE